jgi:HSP20 family molecular chaperone IbpA
MSRIAHTSFPRSKFDMDKWHSQGGPAQDTTSGGGGAPSTLELFDPFDELDNLMSRNLSWINRPVFVRSPDQPRVPHRYRIMVDCAGFKANSINTRLSTDNRTLVVSASEGGKAKNADEDFSLREFQRTYTLPHNVEPDRMVTFMTSTGYLIIEMPVRRDQSRLDHKNDGFPQIVDQSMQINLALPSTIDPARVQVTFKDRDVIVQAQDRKTSSDAMSHVTYYLRSTLPENIDRESLKCSHENNQLSITGRIIPSLSRDERTTHR